MTGKPYVLERLKGFALVALLIGVIFGTCQPLAAQNDPSANLDAIIANAQANGDAKAATRAINLKNALGRLKPSDLQGIRCGKDTTPFPLNVEPAEDVAGKLLDKALETYLPTLAAALASTAAAAATAFLTPTPIGKDSVEVLNNSDTFTQDDVRSAARQMLQDTLPTNFSQLPVPMTSKIVVCSL